VPQLLNKPIHILGVGGIGTALGWALVQGGYSVFLIDNHPGKIAQGRKNGPTLPIGSGDRLQTPPTRLSLAFCRGELPGYLECNFNLIDARDVATGMILAMKKGRTGIRYLLGEENLRLSDWLNILSEETKQPLPRWKVPYSLALLVAWFSELWADHVSGKIPIATVTGVRLTRRNMFFDSSASSKELGLHPRPIREASRDAIAWYRAQGWL